MSSEVTLGSVRTFAGDTVDVILDGDGDVILSRRKVRSWDTVLVPSERDKLRELLGRAAMPGQPEAREGMCQLPGECPNGPDGHPFVPAVAGRSWCLQPHALTVAAVTQAQAEAVGELADAAQDAVTKAEVDRCGYSEDPYHRCRVCYDYAAGREREHPLKAGAATEEGL